MSTNTNPSRGSSIGAGLGSAVKYVLVPFPSCPCPHLVSVQGCLRDRARFALHSLPLRLSSFVPSDVGSPGARADIYTLSGIGNNIRGNAMDFVDSATGTSRQHPETQIGRAQAEEGVQRMEAGRHAAPDPAHTAAPSTTTTAPPPLPPRNEQGTLQSNGSAVGNDAMGGQIRSSI